MANLQMKFDEFQSILQNYSSQTLDKISKSEANIRIYTEELNAIDKGDASENAPLQIARDKLSTENNQLHKLYTQLEAIKQTLESNYVTTGYVHLGSIVSLHLYADDSLQVAEDMDDLHESDFIFKVVMPDLGDYSNMNLLATNSVVGKAIMNRKAGEEVIVVSQSTKYKYRIEEVY